MDPIDMLEMQHLEADHLFRELAVAEDDERNALFQRLAETLTLHTQLEEELFYPTVEAGSTHDLVSHSFEDHAKVKGLLGLMGRRDTDAAEFQRLLVQLRIEVESHVVEERTMLFPLVRVSVDAETLTELGESMQARLNELTNGNELPVFTSEGSVPAPS